MWEPFEVDLDEKMFLNGCEVTHRCWFEEYNWHQNNRESLRFCAADIIHYLARKHLNSVASLWGIFLSFLPTSAKLNMSSVEFI